MKVYVLTEQIRVSFDYEGSHVVGVFARPDQALDYLSSMGYDNLEMTQDGERYIYTFGVDEKCHATPYEVVDPMPRVRVSRLPDSYRKSCHYSDCNYSPIESVQDRIAHIAAAH